MDDIFNKYDSIISLGFNCFPEKYIKLANFKKATHFFDYLGASMWTINQILSTNCSIFNYGDYCNRTIFGDDIVINKKLYLRFPHDFKNNKLNRDDFQNVKLKYTKRLDRFIETIKTSKSIMFIRLDGRIIYNKHISKFKKKELDYIIDFSKIIKNLNPSLDFKIVFISFTNVTKYLEDHNIIILNGIIPRNYTTSNKHIGDLFINNIGMF